MFCYLLQENTAGPSKSDKNASDNSEIADIAKSLKVTCSCFVLYFTNGFIINLFRSIGNFQLICSLIILKILPICRDASNDELRQKKKKKSTKSK